MGETKTTYRANVRIRLEGRKTPLEPGDTTTKKPADWLIDGGYMEEVEADAAE